MKLILLNMRSCTVFPLGQLSKWHQLNGNLNLNLPLLLLHHLLSPIFLPKVMCGVILDSQGKKTRLHVITKQHVLCTLCHQEMPYKNKTTNLFSQLKRHHVKEYMQMRGNICTSSSTSSSKASSSRVSIVESFERLTPLSRSSPHHKQLVDAVGDFILEDLKPVAVVDGSGFKKLMKAAEPRFTIPSHTYYSQIVFPQKYGEIKARVDSLLSAAQYCSITTDIWTAKYQTKGYLSLTCHVVDNDWILRSNALSTAVLTTNHTGDKISITLNVLMVFWKIKVKIVGSTTNNASNIKKAMHYLVLDILCSYQF